MAAALRLGTALALGAAGVLASQPAGAACVAPTIEVSPTEAAVGDTVRIRGEAFGTDCYDTGPPPEGEGVLGPPATGIEIRARDGGVEHVLARGNAGSDYTFTAEVVVPAVEAGDVDLVASYESGLDRYETEPVLLQVSSGEAGDKAVSTFGPSAGSGPEGASDNDTTLEQGAKGRRGRHLVPLDRRGPGGCRRLGLHLVAHAPAPLDGPAARIQLMAGLVPGSSIRSWRTFIPCSSE